MSQDSRVTEGRLTSQIKSMKNSTIASGLIGSLAFGFIVAMLGLSLFSVTVGNIVGLSVTLVAFLLLN